MNSSPQYSSSYVLQLILINARSAKRNEISTSINKNCTIATCPSSSALFADVGEKWLFLRPIFGQRSVSESSAGSWTPKFLSLALTLQPRDNILSISTSKYRFGGQTSSVNMADVILQPNGGYYNLSLMSFSANFPRKSKRCVWQTLLPDGCVTYRGRGSPTCAT